MRSLSYRLFVVRALRAHLMRSILAIVGIVIGIAAVSTVVALAEGARTEVSKQIASLGSNLLLVQPGPRNAGRPAARRKQSFADRRRCCCDCAGGSGSADRRTVRG